MDNSVDIQLTIAGSLYPHTRICHSLIHTRRLPRIYLCGPLFVRAHRFSWCICLLSLAWLANQIPLISVALSPHPVHSLWTVRQLCMDEHLQYSRTPPTSMIAHTSLAHHVYTRLRRGTSLLHTVMLFLSLGQSPVRATLCHSIRPCNDHQRG